MPRRPRGSFVLQKLGVDAADAVFFEFRYDGWRAAELDALHHAFPELLVIDARARVHLDAVAHVALRGLALDDARTDGQRYGARGAVRRRVRGGRPARAFAGHGFFR